MFPLRRLPTIFSALLLSFLAISYDNRTDLRTRQPPARKQEHPAVITGRITFSGTAPRLPNLPVTGDPHCAGLHPEGLPDEAIVVAGDGAVANVFVYLKGAPRSDGSAREPALLDQVGCQYVPHVLAVQINQAIRVKNSDSVFHNVHALAEINPAANTASTANSEQMVALWLSRIHPPAAAMRIRWMNAYIRVKFESPCFAVTGTDGQYSITDVPAGNYTLVAWHERLGEMTKKITVAPDGKVMEDFVFAR